jgi:hypothetical protein
MKKNTRKFLKIILSLSIIFSLTLFYITTSKKQEMKKMTQVEKKLPAKRLQPLEYEGAMLVGDVTDINDIMNELNSEPTAGGGTFDAQEVANSVTQEVLKAFSDSTQRALPLIAHWNVGGDTEDTPFDPLAMMKRLELGEHVLASWKLDPYYNDNIGMSYYEESIKRAAELHLPLVFILPAPESGLIEDSYFASLDKEENPDVVTRDGSILEKLSPFGASSLWNEVGEQWSSTALMAQIQEWYPNPPLVIFVSQNEVDKLKWNEIEEDVRYTDKDKDDNFKRTLIDAEWIEKYRQLHEGFKQGFTQQEWKDNVKFISYNKLSQNLGVDSSWVNSATYTNNYINIWPLTADGVTVDFDLRDIENDQSVNAPHVAINNLPFMLSEAKAINPKFTYQLNINDNENITNPERYRGLTQFALWFLRPSTIRQGSTSTESEHLTTMFQEVSDSVELIHYNASLADFWQNGSLVTSGESELNANVPAEYKNDPRWFLLDADANPQRPWNDTTQIAVWSFALVKGEAPNREWLVYAQSPEGDKKDVTITLPEYGDLMVDASEMGSFYVVKEGGSTTKSVVTTDVDKTPTNPYLEQFTLPTCDATNPEVFFIKSNDDWSHINDKDKTIFCVSPGDYSSLGSVELTASGSEDKRRYIVLDNGNDVHPASLDESEQANISLVFNSASYWIVDRMSNINDTKEPSFGFKNSASHNILNKINLQNYYYGVIIYPFCHYNTVQNSYLDQMSVEGILSDNVGLALAGNTEGARIKGTKFINNDIRNANDGIQLVRSSNIVDIQFPGTIIDSNVIWMDKDIYTNGDYDTSGFNNGKYMIGENAIDLKAASDDKNNPVIITNNKMWGYQQGDKTAGGTFSASSGTAFVVHFGVNNVLFEHNIIFDSQRAFTMGGTIPEIEYSAENWSIKNNLFYNLNLVNPLDEKTYATYFYNANDLKIENNIFHNIPKNNQDKGYFFRFENTINSTFKYNYVINAYGTSASGDNEVLDNYFYEAEESFSGNKVKHQDVFNPNNLKDISFLYKRFTLNPSKMELNQVIPDSIDF